MKTDITYKFQQILHCFHCSKLILTNKILMCKLMAFTVYASNGVGILTLTSSGSGGGVGGSSLGGGGGGVLFGGSNGGGGGAVLPGGGGRGKEPSPSF